jgi:hypothetical protein
MADVDPLLHVLSVCATGKCALRDFDVRAVSWHQGMCASLLCHGTASIGANAFTFLTVSNHSAMLCVPARVLNLPPSVVRRGT